MMCPWILAFGLWDKTLRGQSQVTQAHYVSLLSTDDERVDFPETSSTTTHHMVSFTDFNSQFLGNFQT